MAHSYDESIQQSRKTIELDPNFGLAHNHLAQAYLQEHRNDEAVAELQKAVQLSGGSPRASPILRAPTPQSARVAKRKSCLTI